MRLQLAGRHDARTVILQEPVVTLGRGPDNTVVLRDPRSSRQHCRIEASDGRLVLSDVGSQNGTFLNGQRVRRAPLAPGDVIQIGGTRIVVEPPSEPARSLTETMPGIDTGSAGDPVADSGGSTGLLRVAEIARQLNSEVATEAVLDGIMDAAIELTGAERGFLILAEKESMAFRAARNFARESVPEPEFAVSWSIAIRVGTTGQPVLAINAGEEDGLRGIESVENLALRSIMCVPFTLKNRILGVVYVDDRRRNGAFSRHQLRILEALADHAAVALENRRLLEETRERAREVEDLNRKLSERVRAREEELVRVREEIRREAPSSGGLPGVAGESQVLRDIAALVRKIADTDLPVLITGESGTGKELVARAIHRLGSRRRAAFVGENCAALPETLLESELFGYRKGAFTGADRDRKGLFEVASGGTLFLDEVGEMSPTMQTKLLRVLQENEVRPLGAKEAVPLRVRLIASTNRDLRREIAEGRFREDLYYRLKVVPIVVPPLRERRGDVQLLVEHFLAEAARRDGRERRRLAPDVLEVFASYRWPGNVRELENEIRRMSALAEDTVIGKDLLSPHIVEQAELLGGDESGFHDLNTFVEAIETREIRKALRKSAGNKTRAAELLGITRFTLQRKIDKYGLEEAARS